MITAIRLDQLKILLLSHRHQLLMQTTKESMLINLTLQEIPLKTRTRSVCLSMRPCPTLSILLLDTTLSILTVTVYIALCTEPAFQTRFRLFSVILIINFSAIVLSVWRLNVSTCLQEVFHHFKYKGLSSSLTHLYFIVLSHLFKEEVTLAMYRCQKCMKRPGVVTKTLGFKASWHACSLMLLKARIKMPKMKMCHNRLKKNHYSNRQTKTKLIRRLKKQKQLLQVFMTIWRKCKVKTYQRKEVSYLRAIMMTIIKIMV
jgi:hypothetical protein